MNHARTYSVHVLALTAAALLLAGPAAALPEWGTQVSASAADCPSFCTNFTFGTPVGSGFNDGSGFVDVSTNQGNAMASAQLATGPDLIVPTLKAEAYSGPFSGGGAFGRAFGVEGYTYTGAGSKTFNLDLTLTGSVFDPTPGDLDTTIRAQVYIFESDPFEFFSDLGTLIFEVGAVEIDSVDLTLGDGLNQMVSDSLAFTLSSGESVYLWARLDAEAERDQSYADAFSTLDFEFQDSEGLEISSVVPEPGTLSLMALGMVVLAGRRRSAARRA